LTFADALRLALRNLGQAKLRTALTTLGVAIGIASLAGMVSLGVGLEDQLVGRLTRSGVFDTITVMSGRDLPGGLATLGGAGRRGRAIHGRGTQPDRPSPDLDDEALKQLTAMPEVRDAYPNLRVPVEVKYQDFSEFSGATGVPMSARGEGAFQSMAFGEFFASDPAGQCMVSLDFAKRIDEAAPGSLVGKDLTLTYAGSPVGGGALPFDGLPLMQVQRLRSPCRVTGVVERESGPGIGGGVSAVMIPLDKAREMSASMLAGPQALLRDPAVKRSYPGVTVKVRRAQDTQDVEDRIKKLGFNAFSVNDALKGAKRAFILLDIVLSVIGSIALAVSSLGIVNTMVMSILERTREIGIMKAIGGSDGDIRRIFLIEASAIGLLGGLAGVALGWSVGRVINFGANVYIQRQGGTTGNLFSLPLWLIAGAIGFSIAVSLIAGSYPAARAARLDPIQALRHD
jgi:putative ABC transport system permease protein